MLLGPVVLLPEQLYPKKGISTATIRLVCAIMEEAIHCFQSYALGRTRREKRLFREAEDWFKSTDTTWPFSFENICSILDLDSGYIRNGLQTWLEARMTGVNAEVPQEKHTA